MRTPRLTVALLILVLLVPLAVGCMRVRTTITISEDDVVSGQIMAVSQPVNPEDKGPQLSPGNLTFSEKVAVSDFAEDGYVGSLAVFSDLTFAEVPQLARMNADADGVDLSLRRAGNSVILEGRANLTKVTDSSADVSLSVSFPGEVTSTNGDTISSDVVEWQLKPGLVTTMNAQARYTDPSERSFTGAAVWLVVGSFLAAGLVGALAYASRDRSPKPADTP